MGKNVLRYLGAAVPGAAPTSPASASLIHATLLLLVVVAFFVGAVKTDDLLRLRLLRGLAMAGTRPQLQVQSNISQIEFETKHREYFDLVEQNQRRRLISTFNYDEENIVRKKLFRFTHSGLEISRSPSGRLYDITYDVHIPAAESNARVDIDDTSIRLLIVPTTCGSRRKVTLRVVRPDVARNLSEETFHADPCLPRWVSLDLVPGGVTQRDASLRLRIECDECERTGIQLAQPYLNVIASVRSRHRRRRTTTTKRSRRNCDRAPLEVNFAKLPGYHYIVQPKTINVGLCSGRCPVRWRMTQHAILQHLVSKSNATVPKPCCSPSKMEGLEYLYLSEDDSSKLNVGFWNDTIVVECRCS